MKQHQASCFDRRVGWMVDRRAPRTETQFLNSAGLGLSQTGAAESSYGKTYKNRTKAHQRTIRLQFNHFAPLKTDDR